MDERLRFVAPLLEGEKMAVLCRDFYISRKTGYDGETCRLEPAADPFEAAVVPMSPV